MKRIRLPRYGAATLGVLIIGSALGAVVARHPASTPPTRRPFNRHAVAEMAPNRVGEAPRVDTEHVSGPEQEQYDNRAYPAAHISSTRREAARSAFDQVSRRQHGKLHGWEEIGPFTPSVPAEATYTGRPTTNSGRVTALAISPRCEKHDCALLVGAAGGGVWKTDDALDARPDWAPSNDGIPSNAIGSLIFDPTDSRRRTLYVGTGEPNGSSDSEAGVGLYKSTDGGRSWSLVAGSVAVSRDRSIAAIAVDPLDSRHLFIGTAVARHGSSSVNGGRFTPPGAPTIGVYESRNGGATFALVFSRVSDAVDPTSPNGSDFFRGGVSKLETDRTGLGPRDRTRVYVSVFDYGLYRSTASGAFEQVFASAGGGLPENNSITSRTEFALAPRGTKLRIYVGDAGGGPADFYRVDDANVAAASLTDGVNNLGWMKLSNSTPGTPGFGSFNYCGEQCSYDMPVASPPGQPDVVWIGGQMQYDEIFTATPPSNGRAVQRSTNAGVSFTDMTNDTQSPPLGMHPDQHAIAFLPGNPDIAFLGSDGGVVRTSGRFADASADCDGRGLVGVDLIDCKAWLRSIPTRITSLNDGLRTLQFQSVSLDANRPEKNLLGGTQDNGTWAFSGKAKSWFESVGGDGGQSGIDVGNTRIRMHTYFGPQGDVNFRGNDPLGWNWWGDPLNDSGEAASFYVPLINDPKVAGTWFIGLQHVWRTKDNAGNQAFLEQHCNEFFGDFTVSCGDWEPLGGEAGDLTAGPADKGTGYVVATERAPGDSKTLWAATRRGRVFISKNADAAVASVAFTRIDTITQPRRFVSGISIDPTNPYHAYVSFSGYNAYTPTTPGHVFEVRFNPVTGTAVWTDRSYDLGDQPITSVAFDPDTGDVFASTDYGVLMLPRGGSSWSPAASSLPSGAVYGLTIDSDSRLLYAATHGRGIWRLRLQDSDDVETDHGR